MQTASGGPLKKPRIKLNGQWRELNYEGNGDFSTQTKKGKMFFTTGKKSPKSIVGNKEIVVTPEQTTIQEKQDNTKNYYSAYNPDDIIKGFNALTLGGLNNLSPTQWARRVYDTGKLLSGNMTWSGYTNSWLNGNNGLVSQKFSEEHPYLSTGINLVGDVGIGGGALLSKTNLGQETIARAKGVLDATKYGLYDRVQGYNLYNKFLKGKTADLRSQLEDINLFSGENYVGNNQISDKSGRLFMQPTTYTRSEQIGSGPSIRMGFSANNGKLSRNLVNQGKEAIDKLPAGTSISADAHGLSVPSRLATEGNREGIITTLQRGTSDAETTLSNLERRLGEDPGTFVRNPYDMSADAHRFFTLEAQKPGRQLVYAGRSGKWNDAAVSNPEIYQWQQAYESGTLSARDYVNNYNSWVKDFGGRPGHVDINGKPYFYHPTIFITHKQGGKMNAIERFKQGSKIHIKKKNRGKFTAYCGGNVTSSCIAKAKASGNPTLVKRATFAANARKWKHQKGGKLCLIPRN